VDLGGVAETSLSRLLTLLQSVTPSRKSLLEAVIHPKVHGPTENTIRQGHKRRLVLQVDLDESLLSGVANYVQDACLQCPPMLSLMEQILGPGTCVKLSLVAVSGVIPYATLAEPYVVRQSKHTDSNVRSQQAVLGISSDHSNMNTLIQNPADGELFKAQTPVFCFDPSNYHAGPPASIPVQNKESPYFFAIRWFILMSRTTQPTQSIQEMQHAEKLRETGVLPFTFNIKLPRVNLFAAAASGNLRHVAEALLMGVPMRSVNRYGETAGYIAAHKGHTRVLEYLLDHGLDIEEHPNCGSSPPQESTADFKTPLAIRTHCTHTFLHMASALGHLQLLSMLLKRGASVNVFREIRDFSRRIVSGGESPLYIAAEHGHTEAVVLLMQFGADLDRGRFSDGKTALMAAVDTGNIKTVRALLRKGANVDARDTNGASAIYCAIYGRRVEVLEVLFEFGAREENSCHGRRKSLLTMAAEVGDCEIVRVLLAKGADMNMPTGHQYTPLSQAVVSDNIECVQLLLRLGANVNHGGRENDTALLAAVHYWRNDIAIHLLECGADVNLMNTSGVSPLYAAALQGNTSMFGTLLEYGADIDAIPPNIRHVKLTTGVADLYDTTLLARTMARNGEHQFFRSAVEAGNLTVPLVQWVPFLERSALVQLETWVTDALFFERASFAAFFDETCDEELSMQTEVDGPVAEELACMVAYPLAATRRILRELEEYFVDWLDRS
jgi:ankyrin repeat protein